MAELVQLSLESMLPELEQMERVQLCSKEEVRSLMKRRKRFEYQLQKQTKSKEDFLAYIQYEMGVLDLVHMRREKIQYFHKKDDIDNPIARRINKNYKILEHRFGTDKKIWRSHIDFLKKMKWFDAAGKIYRRMLQVHVHDEGLWVAAAKFELEDLGNAESARNIMLEGLRFHKASEMLYREYFRLELMYVEQLQKRAEVLGGTAEVAAENLDAVLAGKIASAVLRSAIKGVAESEAKDKDVAAFVCSLLGVASCFTFQAGMDAQQEIVGFLESDYSQQAITWDTLARRSLGQDGGDLEAFLAIYQRGLSTVEGASAREALTGMLVDTLLELGATSDLSTGQADALTSALLTALAVGDKDGLLKEEHYLDWLFLYEQDADRYSKILSSALKRLPTSAPLLQKKFARSFAKDENLGGVISAFKTTVRALDHNDLAVHELWTFFVANVRIRSADAAGRLLKEATSDGSLDSGRTFLREVYLEHLYSSAKGLDGAREYYDQERYRPPFSKRLHIKMLELERAAGDKAMDVGRVRKVFQAVTDQFGKNNTGLWLDFMSFESDHGKAKDVEILRHRALQTLETEGLKKKFTEEYENPTKKDIDN